MDLSPILGLIVIEGYVGLPGSGKTYTIVELALKEAKSRPVFSNFPIAHENVHLYGPDDVLDLPPGLIIMDEAHLYMPARGSLQLPMSWLALFSQTRKRGWDLLWSTQHENRVDRVLRDVTNWMWLCEARKFPWDERGVVRAFVAKCYSPDQFRRPAGYQYPVTRRFKQSVADAYDTFEQIEAARHLRRGDAYQKGT